MRECCVCVCVCALSRWSVRIYVVYALIHGRLWMTHSCATTQNAEYMCQVRALFPTRARQTHNFTTHVFEQRVCTHMHRMDNNYTHTVHTYA